MSHSNGTCFGFEMVNKIPTWKAYYHRVTRAFHMWKEDVRLAPKDLRNTLPTGAEKGIDDIRGGQKINSGIA